MRQSFSTIYVTEQAAMFCEYRRLIYSTRTDFIELVRGQHHDSKQVLKSLNLSSRDVTLFRWGFFRKEGPRLIWQIWSIPQR